MIQLDGKALAAELEKQLAQRINNRRICLAIVQVGNDVASSTYVKNKMAACARLGIIAQHHSLANDVDQQAVATLIRKLNCDATVNGLLVQLPLPKDWQTAALLRLISPLKDVDVFRKQTLSLRTKNGDYVTPCVVGAIEALRKKYNIPFQQKRIVVVGKGRTGGGPVYRWYAAQGADVIALTKSCSQNKRKQAIANADIIISAVGRAGIVNTEWLKPGCAFFDIGIFREQTTNKLRGDIDYAQAMNTAHWGTPVPGGIGPLTVISLLTNLETLSRIQDEQTNH